MDANNKKKIEDFKKAVIPLIRTYEIKAKRLDMNLEIKISFDFHKKN